MSREYHGISYVYFRSICDLFSKIESISYSRATKRVLDKLTSIEWVPPQMISYSKDYNGEKIEWETKPGQLPQASGGIHLLPIEQIYQDWKGIVYFEQPEPDEARQRLSTFKIVDFFVSEACVGLYHNEDKNPELYLYTFEDVPKRLGVDIKGYMNLLTLSLGYHYWQQLVVELAASPVRPFQPRGVTAQRVATDMTALYPEFTLEKFVALYDKVRLVR